MRGTTPGWRSTRMTDRAGVSASAVAQPAGPAPKIRTSYWPLVGDTAGRSGGYSGRLRVRTVGNLDGRRESTIRRPRPRLDETKVGEALDSFVHARAEIGIVDRLPIRTLRKRLGALF